jgi:hypothetical protein
MDSGHEASVSTSSPMPLLGKPEDAFFRSECGDTWRQGNGDVDGHVVDEEVQ